MKLSQKTILNFAAIGFALFGVGLYVFNQSALNRLSREDNAIEWLTTIFYLVAAVLFFITGTMKGRGKIWRWGLGALFFLIAGEEISWGQRIFGLTTPETLQNLNVQQETNLHNLSGIHDKVRALGLLFIFGVCYLIPIANRFNTPVRIFLQRLKMPVFPLWAIAVPTIAILFMMIPRLVFHAIVFSLDEVGELFLAAGFLLFALAEMKSSRASRAIQVKINSPHLNAAANKHGGKKLLPSAP